MTCDRRDCGGQLVYVPLRSLVSWRARRCAGVTAQSDAEGDNLGGIRNACACGLRVRTFTICLSGKQPSPRRRRSLLPGTGSGSRTGARSSRRSESACSTVPRVRLGSGSTTARRRQQCGPTNAQRQTGCPRRTWSVHPFRTHGGYANTVIKPASATVPRQHECRTGRETWSRPAVRQ